MRRLATVLALVALLAACAAPATTEPSPSAGVVGPSAASPSDSVPADASPSPVEAVSPSPAASPSPEPQPSPAASPSPAAVASASPTPAPTPTPRPTPTPAATPSPYVVVAVGDSILANSPMYCPGCTGFVTKYGRSLSAAGHRAVSVRNLATLGLQTSGLLAQVRSDATRRAAIRASSVVIVSVGMNDGPWRHTDDPCDGSVTLDDPPSVVMAALEGYTPACAKAYAEAYRARLQAIFSTIRSLHGSRPGIFLALNRYNDWIGYRPPDLPEAAELEKVSPLIVAAWNTVYCDVAAANGFHCIDLSTRFNGPDGTSPSGNLVVSDYTHPSQAGQDAILKLMVAVGFKPLVT